jgi:hypothetical protein
MALSITTINTAITDTLSSASGLSFTQDFDELGEGIVDTPLLQVYWQGTQTDVVQETDRTTFGKGIAQSRITFNADLYATQRMEIGQDMGVLLPLVDAIHAELDSQVSPLFGITDVNGANIIKTLEPWNANFVIFEYAGFSFVGARFVISVRVF